MKPTVFIHTNERQRLGALVAAHALRRNSAHADAFEIRLLETRDFGFLAEREGQPFLRGGAERIWKMDDLQSFTPLRFLPPRLMGFDGRALVIDPDIFAVGDVWELLSRDMLGRIYDGLGKPIDGYPASFSSLSLDVNGVPINPDARTYPRDFIQTGLSCIDGMKLQIFQ